jgi:hypothetical protein
MGNSVPYYVCNQMKDHMTTNQQFLRESILHVLGVQDELCINDLNRWVAHYHMDEIKERGIQWTWQHLIASSRKYLVDKGTLKMDTVNNTNWYSRNITIEDFLDEDGVLTEEYWDENYVLVVWFKDGFNPKELDGVEQTDNGFEYDGITIKWDGDNYRTELLVPFNWDEEDPEILWRNEVINNRLDISWVKDSLITG